MTNQAQFTKHSYALENLGIDYSFHSHGLSVEIESWTRAFKAVGFKRVDREVAEKLMGPRNFNPMDYQDANTYNDTTIIANDINYGLNEIPEMGAVEAERHNLAGGTLLAFKEHKGGDIRGSYTKSKYMVSPESEQDMMHELVRVLSPEINFSLETDDGQEVTGRVTAHGYTEFDRNDLDLDDTDIQEIMEMTGSQRRANVNLANVM